MEDRQPDTIERVLAEGLASYNSAQPLAGFEQRILARVYADRARRKAAWWAGAIAATAAAAMIAAVSMRPAPEPLSWRPRSPEAPAVSQVALPADAPRVAPSARVASAPSRIAPPSEPLTSQERALLMLATAFPDQLRALQLPNDDPIQIQDLKIASLDDEESRKGE